MKVSELTINKEGTVQIEQFEPIKSSYTIKVTIEKGDDVEKVKEELDAVLNKWVEMDRLKWKSPNRAITAGRKLGVYPPRDPIKNLSEPEPF